PVLRARRADPEPDPRDLRRPGEPGLQAPAAAHPSRGAAGGGRRRGRRPAGQVLGDARQDLRRPARAVRRQVRRMGAGAGSRPRALRPRPQVGGGARAHRAGRAGGGTLRRVGHAGVLHQRALPLRRAALRRLPARDRRRAEALMARRPACAAALAAALPAASAPAAAEPAPPLAVLEHGQGLSGVSRRSNDVAASPDGRHVYAVTDLYAIVLRREPDGTLSFVAESELFTPGARIVAPHDGLGMLVLATNPGVALLVSYTRSPTDGTLAFVENEESDLADSAADLAVSRDGALVYVASPGQDAVVVYRRT